jgi:hypothetical protein
VQRPCGGNPLGEFESSAGAKHQWLMPVIVATQEAEIRRIAVQSQSPANSL